MTSYIRNIPQDARHLIPKPFWAQVATIFVLGFVGVLIATL